MPTVVGVRFKPVTKIYYFLPAENAEYQLDDPIIVETARGLELGRIAIASKEVPKSELKGPLKKVIRRATPIDLMARNSYALQRDVALSLCREKVVELDLPMQVIDAEYSFDGARILFSFSAEQRVDFRDLVRILVRNLRTRVEMRQIGARDEAKIIDGYGRCGRQLCCSSWLTEFHPVSIRMAKNQQLPLAPTEISGVCGRLLCCLAYEDTMYKEMKKALPKVGTKVQTLDGPGTIKGLNILKQTVIVEIEETRYRSEYTLDKIAPPGEVIVERPPEDEGIEAPQISSPVESNSKPNSTKSTTPETKGVQPNRKRPATSKSKAAKSLESKKGSKSSSQPRRRKKSRNKKRATNPKHNNT